MERAGEWAHGLRHYRRAKLCQIHRKRYRCSRTSMKSAPQNNAGPYKLALIGRHWCWEMARKWDP
eukprot:1339427-Karenia_brevis.AAC.1